MAQGRFVEFLHYGNWSPLRRAHWSGSVAGAIAIATGFSVFVMWFEQSESTPQQFVLILGAAGLLSLVFELLRGQIENHEESWRLSSIIVTFVLLVIFELYVMGVHGALSVLLSEKPETREALTQAILGSGIAGSKGILNLLVIAGLWFALGIIVAYRLAGTVHAYATGKFELQGASRIPNFWSGAASGLITGVVAGPISVLLYVLVARLINEFFWMTTDHDAWKAHLHAAGATFQRLPSYIGGFFGISFAAIDAVDNFLFEKFPHWGPALLILISILLIWFLVTRAGKNQLKWGYIPLIALIVVFGLPLLADIGDLLRLALIVAVSWGGVGLVLGALIPWLRKPSEHSNEWGLIAFGAAMVMFLATIFSWSKFWPRTINLMLMLFFIAAGFSFRRIGEIERYWPILALSVATIIFGVTRTQQSLEFLNIQRQAYFLSISKPLVFPDQILGKSPSPATAAEKDLLQAFKNIRSLGSIGSWDFTGTAADRDEDRQIESALKKTDESIAQKQKMLEAFERYKPAEQLSRFPEVIGGAQNVITLIQDAERDVRAAIARNQRELADLTANPGTGITQLLHDSSLSRSQTRVTYFRGKLTSLQTLETVHGKSIEELKRLPEQVELQQTLSKRLELALTTSLGFWVTIGMLASWSICRDRHA